VYITNMDCLDVNVHVHDGLFNEFNSAKLEKYDVAPQSNYVHVFDVGWCVWEPFFSWSVSQCSIDSTWFPFDEQSCSLIYQSWKYNPHEVNFTSDILGKQVDHTIWKYDLSPNAVWDFVGNRLLSTTYSVYLCRPTLHMYLRY